jgi:hypothetical protein
MTSPVFKQVAHEQVHNRQVQKYKFNYSYSISANVAASATTPFTLAIEQDADFLLEKVTGSCLGPVDANGIPQVANTDFPQPGIAVGAGHAGRGLTLRITDTGAGRDLTNGFLAVENTLTPGYGIQMFLPYPLKYFARRNSKLRFDFRNRDTQGRHQVDITLNGYKFQMPEMPDTLEVNRSVGGNARVA